MKKLADSVRVKEYYTLGEFQEAEEGFEPETLFETDPEARRNYLVLSLNGTGYFEANHYLDEYDDDSYEVGVNAETLAGLVRLQRFKNDFGVAMCYTPASLKGEIVSEDESYYSNASYGRSYCRGNRALRLDKARTRDFLNMEGTTLEDAENAVIYFLESRGYE